MEQLFSKLRFTKQLFSKLKLQNSVAEAEKNRMSWIRLSESLEFLTAGIGLQQFFQ